MANAHFKLVLVNGRLKSGSAPVTCRTPVCAGVTQHSGFGLNSTTFVREVGSLCYFAPTIWYSQASRHT